MCLWRINIYQAYNIIVICLQIKYFLQFKSDYEYFQIGAGVVKDKQDLQPAAKWEIGKSWRKNLWKVFWCTGSESNDPRGSLPAENWIWSDFFFSTLWKYVGLVCWMEVVVTLSSWSNEVIGLGLTCYPHIRYGSQAPTYQASLLQLPTELWDYCLPSYLP